jgi:hypothetical protein
MSEPSRTSYTVELRIEGELLVPDEITVQTGLSPSLTRNVGERRGKASIFDKALWAFDGGVRNEKLKEWNSLETGLLEVMAALRPHFPLIRSLVGTFDVYWWCGQFSDTMASAVFSPILLNELADLGVPIFIHTYFSVQGPNG